VTKNQHYWLAVDALTQPMQVREEPQRYGRKDDEAKKGNALESGTERS
jgi:hypothetical protein